MSKKEISPAEAIAKKPTAKSDYEIERGKPLPSFNHALIQSCLSSLLRLKVKSKSERR